MSLRGLWFVWWYVGENDWKLKIGKYLCFTFATQVTAHLENDAVDDRTLGHLSCLPDCYSFPRERSLA